jgi:tripartite-type tricarboxylate transporter receptor subunit TctC
VVVKANVGSAMVSALVFLALQGHALHAQGYPDRQVRVIVPYAPGGSTDIAGRLVAQRLAGELKQPVVVENRDGAGGNIGADLVAKANPDGYTLLVGTAGGITINPSLYKAMPFDPIRDLAAVAYFGSTPNILVVHPSLPVKSVRELVALARARPGQLNYASAGAGGAVHLAAELFRSMANLDMVHIPYKGSAPALTDLLGGQTQLMFSTLPPALPYVKSAKLRALGVTGVTRSSLVPELPTISEAGLKGYEITQWWGMLAPSRTPAEVVARLNADINRVLRQPELVQQFAALGADPSRNTSEWFAAYIRSETAKWSKVVKASGAVVN